MRPIALIAAELGALIGDRPDAMRLLQELLSSDVTLLSRDAEVLKERRASDRARQKLKRDNDIAAKQTMGGAIISSHVKSRDEPKTSCNLLPVSLAKPLVEKKEETGGSARARGTRLSADSQITTENRYFAAAAGIPEADIDRMWSEFIDYWIAVPGARGTKLNWNATWRNRVRTLIDRKGRAYGNGTRSLATAADDLIARAEEFDLARGPVIDH